MKACLFKMNKRDFRNVFIALCLFSLLTQCSLVEKGLQQVSKFWSILCRVCSNPTKAVVWKLRCKYWYFIRGNHPLRQHLTGLPSQHGGQSAVWPMESGSHFITRLNWVENGKSTTQDPIWSHNLGPEERQSRGKTPPLHLTTPDSIQGLLTSNVIAGCCVQCVHIAERCLV